MKKMVIDKSFKPKELLQRSSPHLKPRFTVSDAMRGVIIALLPGIAVMFYLYGWNIITHIIFCVLLALGMEATMLYLRKRPVLPYLKDYSAVLTAILLALALPQFAPWWLLTIGIFFAIVISKQLYGGLGYNPFNPAMVAYAILIVSFPTQMSTYWQVPALAHVPWPHYQPGFLESWQYLFSGHLNGGQAIDSITAATPLDHVKTMLKSGTANISEITASGHAFGAFGGLGTEWVNLAFLLGGLWMIYKNYIRWHIPLAFLASLFVCALVFGTFVDTDLHPDPLFHLFSGATMLGAFFIATDPVTAATTPRGRLIYGAGIGLLVYIIRAYGGYPDGVAFAVLLMNITVPLLDYFTQPRVYGHDK